VVRWMCRKGPVGLLEMLQTSLVVKTGGIIYMSASSTHVCVWGGRVCARRRVYVRLFDHTNRRSTCSIGGEVAMAD
jgi:hypothetical protein